MRTLIITAGIVLFVALFGFAPGTAFAGGRPTVTDEDGEDPTSGRSDPNADPIPQRVPDRRSVSESRDEFQTERDNPNGPDEIGVQPMPKAARKRDDPRHRRGRRHRDEAPTESHRDQPSGPILVSMASVPNTEAVIPSAWQNNNPGNIKEPRSGPWPGTLGYDSKGHAKFATIEVGAMNLMACLLKNTATGAYGTPERMVAKYTTTQNDRVDYVKTIRQWTGIRSNERIVLWRGGQPDKERLFRLVQAVVTYEEAHGPLSAGVLERAFAMLTGRQEV